MTASRSAQLSETAEHRMKLSIVTHSFQSYMYDFNTHTFKLHSMKHLQLQDSLLDVLEGFEIKHHTVIILKFNY